MTLLNSFPYQEINLWHRYDYLLAEDLKKTHCSLNDANVSVQSHTFFVRAPSEETRKYIFKSYDEIMLAPLVMFSPEILEEEQVEKLEGRRRLWERSSDIYDGQPNDPISQAQLSIYPPPPQSNPTQPIPSDLKINGVGPTSDPTSTPARALLPASTTAEATPRSSAPGSPVPEVPPAPGSATPNIPAGPSPTELAIHRDSHLPLLPLEQAIATSITHAAKGDDKKTRDFLASIMLVGGGGLVGGVGSFNIFLEERLRAHVAEKGIGGEGVQVVVGVPPRELDPQVVVWKGASVFGRLKGNDCWIGRREFEMLGVRLLTYKCLWHY